MFFVLFQVYLSISVILITLLVMIQSPPNSCTYWWELFQLILAVYVKTHDSFCLVEYCLIHLDILTTITLILLANFSSTQHVDQLVWLVLSLSKKNGHCTKFMIILCLLYIVDWNELFCYGLEGNMGNCNLCILMCELPTCGVWEDTNKTSIG